MKKSTNSSTNPLFKALDLFDALILKGWKVFISLKFGISLLLLIGAVCIWGTMAVASNAALGDNAITMARTLVFEGFWFNALLVLFAVQLMFSTWHVTKMSVQIWWKKEFRRSPEYYEAGSSPRGAMKLAGTLQDAESILRKNFTFVHRDGNALYAQRGLLSRLGPTIVHIGLLTVIGATVTKAVFMANGSIVIEGRFIAGEGEEYSYINQPVAPEQQITAENRRESSIDSWIRVLDFDVVNHPNSQIPAYFSSLVEIRDPKTQEVTVAQLDMNHSLRVKDSQYGWLQFHQASYDAIPDGEIHRVNFDVRDRKTGERIAVTDTHGGNRVRVGGSDLFLEVTGIQPADRWRLYHMSAPNVEVASGLLTGDRTLRYSFEPLEFYTDFRIDEATQQPKNASPLPNNPALKVGIYLNDRQVEKRWLFADPRLADMMPDSHPRYDVRLVDVQTMQGLDLNTIDWKSPSAARYLVSLRDREANDGGTTETLLLNQRSKTYEYASNVDHGAALLGTEKDYEVRILGSAQRYLTVLSVVNEPTVPYLYLGVAIIALGALMTFTVRYTAFYALWDPEAKVLSAALVPRWGQTVVTDQFDALVNQLSGGKGLVRKTTEGAIPDEDAPAHRGTRVNPFSN